MIFYEPWPDSNFEWEEANTTCNDEVFRLFNGSSLNAYWLPIKFELITERDGKLLKPSDFPWYRSNSLVMRKKAYDMLADIFIKNGEILPLETDNDVELYVFNSQVISALDEKRSLLKRFSDSRRIMYIEKHEFIKSKLLYVDMFRLPGRANELYVSEHFVERYKSAGLVGLEFKEIWRSNSYKTEECVEPNSNDVLAWDGIAYTNKQDKEYYKNMNSSELANNPKSDFEEAWNNIKLGYADEKDYDTAIEFSKKNIELNPNDALAYSAMGTVYLHKQDYDNTIECCKKAIELNVPDLAGTYNSIGLAYFNKQDYDKAIECYEKAIELDTNYAYIDYFNMGNAYESKQGYDKAIECYEKASELNPQVIGMIYYYIGNVYIQKGDKRKGTEYQKKAKRHGYKPQ